MEYEPNEKIYADIKRICLKSFKRKSKPQPVALMQEIWESTDFPMHCPEHHYLIPAVLLTVYRRLKKDSREQLKEDLDRALERSRNVLAGFCGWYGSCGAAVGSGIFLSILTDTNPYSTDTWGTVNRITSECLAGIAALGGPRCCKRVCFATVGVVAGFMKENMRLDIGKLPAITCSFHEKNAECKRMLCPYHPEGEGEEQ